MESVKADSAKRAKDEGAACGTHAPPPPGERARTCTCAFAVHVCALAVCARDRCACRAGVCACRLRSRAPAWRAHGAGTVSKREWRMGLKFLGLEAPRKTVDELFDAIDRDGGGAIELTELHRYLKYGDGGGRKTWLPAEGGDGASADPGAGLGVRRESINQALAAGTTERRHGVIASTAVMARAGAWRPRDHPRAAASRRAPRCDRAPHATRRAAVRSRGVCLPRIHPT
eukprot:3783468-Prymnesium_polylepis.1